MNEELKKLYGFMRTNHPDYIGSTTEEDFVGTLSDRSVYRKWLDDVETKIPGIYQGSSKEDMLNTIAPAEGYLAPAQFQRFGIEDKQKSLLDNPQYLIDKRTQELQSQGEQDALAQKPNTRSGTLHGEPQYFAPSTLSTNEKKQIRVGAGMQALVDNNHDPKSVTSSELSNFIFPGERKTAENAADLLTLGKFQGVDNSLLTTEQRSNLNYSGGAPNFAPAVKKQDGTLFSPNEVINLKPTDVPWVNPKNLLDAQEYLSADNRVRMGQDLKDINLHSQYAQYYLDHAVPKELPQAIQEATDLFAKHKDGTATEEDLYRGEQLSKYFESIPENIQKGYVNANDVLQENADKIAHITDNYPDVAVANKLNRELTVKAGENQNSPAAKLAKGLLGMLVLPPPLAIVDAIKGTGVAQGAGEAIMDLGIGVAETIPKLTGKVASTIDALDAVGGDQLAAEREIRRSVELRPYGTTIKAPNQERPISEKYTTFEHNGKEWQMTFDEKGKPVDIYDETGLPAELSNKERTDLMTEADQKGLSALTVKHYNKSAIFNSIGETTSDFLGTVALAYLVPGIGDEALAAKVKEFSAMILQYTGDYTQEGLAQGLNMEQAAGHGAFMAATDAIIFSANPVAAKLTSSAEQSAAKLGIKRILAGTDTKEIRQLVKQEFLKTLTQPPTVGLQATATTIAHPVVNRAFNNYMGSDLPTDLPTTGQMLESFGMATLSSILPVMVGGIRSVSRVSGDKFKTESIYSSTINADKIGGVVKDFNIKGGEELVPILQATKAASSHILENADLTEKQKMDKVAEIFDVYKRRADLQKAQGTTAVDGIKKDIEVLQKKADAPINTEPPVVENTPIQLPEAGGKIFSDYDGTMSDKGHITPLGEELKQRILNGEDVTILTARKGLDGQTKLDIAKELGVDPEKLNVITDLTPEGKAAQLTDNSTFYDNNPDNVAAAKARGNVNVVDTGKALEASVSKIGEVGNSVGGDKSALQKPIEVGNIVIDADGKEYEVVGLTTSRKGTPQAEVKLPKRTDAEIDEDARRNVFGRNENRLLYKDYNDPKFIKEQSIAISQEKSEQQKINNSSEGSTTLDLSELKTKEQPTEPIQSKVEQAAKERVDAFVSTIKDKKLKAKLESDPESALNDLIAFHKKEIAGTEDANTQKFHQKAILTLNEVKQDLNTSKGIENPKPVTKESALAAVRELADKSDPSAQDATRIFKSGEETYVKTGVTVEDIQKVLDESNAKKAVDNKTGGIIPPEKSSPQVAQDLQNVQSGEDIPPELPYVPQVGDRVTVSSPTGVKIKGNVEVKSVNPDGSVQTELGQAPPNQIKLETPVVTSTVTGTKNSISRAIREALGLPPVEIPKGLTDSEKLQNGKNLADSGEIDPYDLVERVLSARQGMHGVQPDEAAVMAYHMFDLKSQETALRDNLAYAATPEEKRVITQQLLQLKDTQDRATRANAKTSNAWHGVGDMKQIVTDEEFNPHREILTTKDAYFGEVPQAVQDRLAKYEKEAEDSANKIKEIEAKLTKAHADKVLNTTRKTTDTKSHADRVKERTTSLEKARQALIDVAKGKGGVTSSIPLLAQLVAIAPHVKDVFVSLAGEAKDNLEAIVDKLHDQFKTILPGISKKDIYDIIAGKYNVSKERTEAAIRIAELRKEARDISQDNLTNDEVKKQQVKKLNQQADTLEKQFNKLKAKDEKERPQFHTDQGWVEANQRKANNNAKIRHEKATAYASKKNFYQKLLSGVALTSRAFILSGKNVLVKLAAALAIGGALKRIPEQAIGSIYSKIFTKLAKAAPIEGGAYIDSEIKFYKEMFDPKKFAKNTWSILKDHESLLSKKLNEVPHVNLVDALSYEPTNTAGKIGKKSLQVLYRALSLPTDLHQMIKDPLKRAAYEASFMNYMKWASVNGLDINSELVVNTAMNAAYKRANYEIFMEENSLNRHYKKVLADMEASGNVGATGRFIADILLPVTTVPTNIVRRVVSTSPVGLIRGGIKVEEAYRKGIEKLTPAEADAVMRQLKQGTLGTALWLIGWFGAASFGGLYTSFNPNKRRDPDDKASDVMVVNDVAIPKPVQHALLLEIIQLAATARRIYDKYKKEEKSTLESLIVAGIGSIGAMLEQVPVIETPIHAVMATQDPVELKMLKKNLKGRVTPQIFKELGIGTHAFQGVEDIPTIGVSTHKDLLPFLDKWGDKWEKNLYDEAVKQVDEEDYDNDPANQFKKKYAILHPHDITELKKPSEKTGKPIQILTITQARAIKARGEPK